MNAQQLGFMAVLLYKVKILLDSSLIWYAMYLYYCRTTEAFIHFIVDY
jgi:hypothetical protein